MLPRLQLMDAKGSRVDSPIPVNASADTILNNLNLISSTISHNVYPISTPLEQGTQQPRSNPGDVSMIQESLGNLNLGKNHTIMDGKASPQNGASDSYTPGGKALMNALEDSTELEAVSTSSPGMPSLLLKTSRL